MFINVLFVYLACLLCKEGRASTWTKLTRLAGWKIEIDYSAILTTGSISECLLKCINSSPAYCSAIYYNKGTNACEHYQNTLHIVPGGDNDEIVFTSNFIGSGLLVEESGLYSFDTTKCSLVGGQIMTYSEMADIYHNQSGSFKCGYASDGVVRKIIHDAQSVAEALHTCNPTSKRTWCTIHDI